MGSGVKSVIIYVHRMITEFKCSLFDQNMSTGYILILNATDKMVKFT